MSYHKEFKKESEEVITGFCPGCGNDNMQIKIMRGVSIFDLDGVIVEVNDIFRECSGCGCDFEFMGDNATPIADAYKKYEKITGKKWRSTPKKKRRKNVHKS